MTKAFSTSIIIRSTPQVLWAILTDAARWPDWNPTVTRVDGQVAPGAKITVYTKASPGRAFPLTRSIPDLQPSFDEFAAALKRRAETSS